MVCISLMTEFVEICSRHRISRVVFVVFALSLGADRAAKILEVAELNSADFDETLKAQERVFVDFYAPWCDHCNQLEPHFKKAANDARAEELEVLFAKVDIVGNPDLAQKYKVKSYPTLHYFEDGELAKTYDGDRKAETILKWVRKQEVESEEEIEEVEAEAFLSRIKAGEFGLVGRVKKDSVRHKAFAKAVEQLQHYEISTIHCRTVFLPKSADAKADASLVMTRPGFTGPDAERLSYAGAWSDGNIAHWSKIGTYPTIGEVFSVKKYNPAEIVLIGGVGSVVATLDDKAAISEEDKLGPKVKEVLVPLARAHPYWRFTSAEHAELMGREPEILGVKKKFEPMISVLEGQKRWVLEGDENVQNQATVKQFLADVRAKKLKPRYKSTLPPEYIVDGDGVTLLDQEGVTVLTGDTFEEQVLDSKKDVFVFLYGSGCKFSKEMAPEWSKLAQRVADRGWNKDGVVIAKMDGASNGCFEDVTNFPTLFLYPAVAKAKKLKLKQKYTGTRTLEEMTDFLLENANGLEKVRDAMDTGEKSRGAFSMVERELQKKKKRASSEL